jgi:hypothetical protein
MTSPVSAIPYENFYKGFLNNGMFSDIMLDLGTVKHSGHTSILMEHSHWFAANCPNKIKGKFKLVHPAHELLEHFRFGQLIYEQVVSGMRLMIAYCYIGCYRIHGHDQDTTEWQEARSRIHISYSLTCSRAPTASIAWSQTAGYHLPSKIARFDKDVYS